MGIEEALARGATVLTGNQRAARTLREEFDRRQRGLGLERWEPPAILAWDGWTAGLWSRLLLEGHAGNLLLNRAQEHAVWRGIVAGDGAWNSLMTVDSPADLAADAWARLCAYRGERRLQTAGVSVDTRAFQRWATIFEERCRTEGYLTAGQLEGALAEAVAAGKVTLAKGGYVLVGFDGWTPAQQSLAQAAHGVGVGFETLSPEPRSGERLVAEAASEREELECAARWIRRRLEVDAGARVALIVPGHEARRAEIDRVLRRTLAPELEEMTAQWTGLPFEFSLGVPMARTALGETALDLLRWAAGALPVERVSGLLLSPYVAGGAEALARAEFDAYELRRRKMLRPEVTLDAMVRLVEGAKRRPRLPQLLSALKGMRRVVGAEGFAAAGLRPYADWAEAIRALLAAARWGEPGDSLEFQTRRRWESVLDELTTLDFAGVRVGAREALTAVERLTRQTLFAPESRGAPVQVVGPLESAGSTFDAVWFMGAGEMDWPARPTASPLLAWQLQKELGMPGADAGRDSEYAQRMTERIGRGGGAVVFSYAAEGAKGRQRVSAVVAGLGLEVARVQELVPPAEERPVVVLETVEDDTALPALPDRVVRGGARLLQLQAACGFRAFAELRLAASALDAVEPGMDARESGNAVHAALEIFWKQVRSQPALQALLVEERREILASAVGEALRRTAGRDESAWDAAYLEVQRERLMGLLDAWLAMETERAVPFLVRQSETELEDVRIGPLRLHLRVDRVDETEFGDVVVDYKTGPASVADWLGERPDQPQLPLYAVLAGPERLAGVAFAQVRAGKDMGLYGYETEEGVLPRAMRLKEAATLEDQVEEWRACLTVLAEDFHRGDTRVRPKSYPRTCAFCEQRLLCRLDVASIEPNAASLAEGAADEDVAEDDRG